MQFPTNMNEVTRVLQRIQRGEGAAAEDLLPLVYEELRRLAAIRLKEESPGQTLQATALVHEAWLRLTSGEARAAWDHRGHFFAAAAEAIRRILVENHRRKRTAKRGGQMVRRDVELELIEAPSWSDDLLAIDEVLSRLETAHPRKAELVKLHYFAGLTLGEAADVLRISLATAERDWVYARVWLFRELQS